MVNLFVQSATCVMTHIRVVSRRRSPLGFFLFYYSTPRTTELSSPQVKKKPLSGAFSQNQLGPLDYRHTWVATTLHGRAAAQLALFRLYGCTHSVREQERKIKPAPRGRQRKWLTHDGFTRKRRSQNSAQRSWPVQPKAVQGKYDKAAQQRQEGFVLLSPFAPPAGSP